MAELSRCEKNQIIQHLDSLIEKSIVAGDTFKMPPDKDLVSGGKHAMYLLNDIKKAAYLALRDRQTIALKFFTSEEGGHWSEAQASGIVANLTIESFLDPEKKQSPGKGYAIAQWEINGPRAQSFYKFRQRNLVGSFLDDQLRFLNHELTSGEYKTAGDHLRSQTTAADAGRSFAEKFEKMGKQAKNGPPERARQADIIFNSFFSKKK